MDFYGKCSSETALGRNSENLLFESLLYKNLLGDLWWPVQHPFYPPVHQSECNYSGSEGTLLTQNVSAAANVWNTMMLCVLEINSCSIFFQNRAPMWSAQGHILVLWTRQEVPIASCAVHPPARCSRLTTCCVGTTMSPIPLPVIFEEPLAS